MRGAMKATFVAAALGGAVLGGCGGDDDKALSKAEFLKQGNAICDKGNKKLSAAAEEAFGKKSQPTKQDIAKFAEEEAIPAVESQLSDLRALEPPKADKAEVDKILATADAALKKAKADPAVFAGSDPFEEANRMAGDYGLEKCAQ